MLQVRDNAKAAVMRPLVIGYYIGSALFGHKKNGRYATIAAVEFRAAMAGGSAKIKVEMLM
jgi:hypothetical protein